MKKIVVGNWKMHGDAVTAHVLAERAAEQAAKFSKSAEVVLCPPAILAVQLTAWLAGSVVKVGGQDCHAEVQGAFTGDISAAMLHEAGCAYVIVGHSERRQYHHETSEGVRKKAARAIATGLMPIICIGESAKARDSGKAEAIVGRQVRESLPDEVIKGNFMLAYEPVWAIGSGNTPTEDDIRRMHAYITSTASERTELSPGAVSVLYGGSVKADNARAIMAVEGVAGVLVGGASLKAEDFCRIIEATEGF